ncbi:MAG: glycoside hydrolase family 127 protein [Pirellulales bacterium]|nr:glycoside hydrolase family 127 protein [Pirellulales bacterium]
MTWKTVLVFASLTILLPFGIPYHANAEVGKTAIDVYAKYRLKPLDYCDVKLHGDLKRQFNEICDYYYKIPNDDLLKPYRQRAGLAAPGEDMGGQYVGHSPFGQFLAGYARMYAATQDEKYRNKAITLMEEWAKTIEPDGFFFDTRSPRLSAYYYEKLLGGLLDIYFYCDDANSLKYLDKITTWEEKNIPRTRIYCDVIGQGTGEWYTQSENLYRAYLYTGNDRYKKFAQVWEYTEFWNEILDDKHEQMYKKNTWHHAYSHVNSFNGLAAAYIVKGEEKYLDTLKKAYRFMQEQQCWATGGFGPNENLPPRKQLIETLKSTDKHFETQCGSWAGFKMTKYLVGLTGDAKYADWTEKLMINGIGASIPMSEKGNVFYYSSYKPSGAAKQNIKHAWVCCTGTRPQAVSDYHNLIYFHGDKSICIAQYFASEGSFKLGDVSVRILQETAFPEEDITRLIVRLAKPAEFDIKFRLPQWLAAEAVAEVNGECRDYSVDKNWGVLSGTWKNGDTIKLKLPMKFQISRLDETKKYPAAILYGPVALAVQLSENKNNPTKEIDVDNIAKDFIPSTSAPLTWKMRGNDSVVLKPFYQYKKGERYFLYLDD